ncbi:MAG: hypothetical protein M1374_03370 [Firmicutes bacterium]|nr:hypothetical protein [Bacillota bacterium]
MEGDLDPVSGAEPTGLDMLAAAIRFDSYDVQTYGNVLFKAISDIFPPSMIKIERTRSLADKLKGQPGLVKSVAVDLEGQMLLLVLEASGPRGYVVKEVRGVTISKQDVSLPEWIERLKSALEAVSSKNAESAEALRKLLG